MKRKSNLWKFILFIITYLEQVKISLNASDYKNSCLVNFQVTITLS